MLQDDFILRQIREMVHAVMKMLFQVSASELTPLSAQWNCGSIPHRNLIMPIREGFLWNQE